MPAVFLPAVGKPVKVCSNVGWPQDHCQSEGKKTESHHKCCWCVASRHGCHGGITHFLATVFAGRGRPRHTCLVGVKFLGHSLPADLNFALVLTGLCEIVGKLHP